MAVTYSWRLDSNKYAYIVPPIEEMAEVSANTSKTYGYLSNVPLNGNLAHQIATRAEEMFGKDNPNGLEDYINAFAALEAKIDLASTDEGYRQVLFPDGEEEIFKWKNANHYDLLSADVYYNIDAAACTDLRGVGVSGIRYIGAITGKTYVDYSDPENGETSTIVELFGQETSDEGNSFGVDINSQGWVLAGAEVEIEYLMQSEQNGEAKPVIRKEVVRPGIPGFTDLYGIYLTDATADGEGNLEAPEYMFAVRNGKDAGYVHIDYTLPTDVDNVIELELQPIRDEIIVLRNETEESINKLGSGLLIINEAVKNIETSIENSQGGISRTEFNNLASELESLKNRVAYLEAIVDGSGGSGGGGGVIGTNIQVITMSTGDTGRVQIGGTNYNFSPEDNLYVLGTYLPAGTSFTGETRTPTSVDYLFAVPYVKLSKGGVIIDANVETTDGHAFYQGDEETKTKDSDFKTLDSF